MFEDLLHKLIIGVISGFTEFFCVPSAPHLLLYENLTGYVADDPMLTLTIHIGCLLAVILGCKKRLLYLLRADRQERNTRRRRNRHLDLHAVREMKMLKTAVLPLLVAVVLYRWTAAWVTEPLMLALVLIVNGLVLMLPRIFAQGNKDSSTMSPFDSVIMGLVGALSAIPGLSRVGSIVTGAMIRGVAQNHALEYALLLSVPVLALTIGFDIYALITVGVSVTFLQFLAWILAGAAAFGAGYLGILFVRFVCVKTELFTFCYYSWGMAVFSFILYLFVA